MGRQKLAFQSYPAFLAQNHQLIRLLPVVQHRVKCSHTRIRKHNIIFRMTANICYPFIGVKRIKLNLSVSADDL